MNLSFSGLIRGFGLFLFFGGLVGCGTGGGSGLIVDNNALLLSTDLNSTTLSSNNYTTQAVTACTNTSNRCTPGNLQGDICYAIYGLGELGGSGFWGGTWLWPATMMDTQEAREGVCSATTFSLSEQTTFSGKVEIPGTEEEMPATKKIVRVEFNFNYVDATVKINNGTLNDTYTIRTVYVTEYTASDVTGTMLKGDKLIKASGDTKFKWCNTSTCSEDRTAVATGILQDATVTAYQHPGEGNAAYVPVTANFGANGADAIDVTYEQISDLTKTWKLNYKVTDSILWAANPSTFTDASDIVAAFRLKFAPNSSTTNGETDDGLRASMAIE